MVKETGKKTVNLYDPTETRPPGNVVCVIPKALKPLKLVIYRLKLILCFLAGAMAAWLILHALHV